MDIRDMIKTRNLMNNNGPKTKASRSVLRVLNSVKTMEGEGFLVHRSFPTHFLQDVDPFMLLDEMGPMNLPPGRQKAHRIIHIAALRQ
jgi:redox-sensitive bicupin YhaK (pirin superfamily)